MVNRLCVILTVGFKPLVVQRKARSTCHCFRASCSRPGFAPVQRLHIVTLNAATIWWIEASLLSSLATWQAQWEIHQSSSKFWDSPGILPVCCPTIPLGTSELPKSRYKSASCIVHCTCTCTCTEYCTCTVLILWVWHSFTTAKPSNKSPQQHQTSTHSKPAGPRSLRRPSPPYQLHCPQLEGHEWHKLKYAKMIVNAWKLLRVL